MKKSDKRKSFINIRNSVENRYTKSLAIAEKLYGLNEYKLCDTVFIYINMGSEVETVKIISRAFSEGKTVAIPKTSENRNMSFIKFEGFDKLVKSKFGVLEPVEGKEIFPHEKTIFVVPAVAFDISCNRMGYGGGYYDTYLCKYSNAVKIGVAFEEQIFESIPFENHDIVMDIVITDKKIYKRGGNGCGFN